MIRFIYAVIFGLIGLCFGAIVGAPYIGGAAGFLFVAVGPELFELIGWD